MINLNLFQLVDMAFDSMAERLAQNFSSNLETVVQNRAAREQSESLEKPKRVASGRLSRTELEKRLDYLMDELDYQPKDKTLFTA